MGLFSKKTKQTINPDQRELIENAQKRVRQKKRLYRHFIIFMAGAIMMIIMNLALGLGKDFKLFGQDWFIWAILLWTFFLLIHLIQVFVLDTFMNKTWENNQIDKLIQKQKEKIALLEEKVAAEYPLPEKKSPVPKSQTVAATNNNFPQ